LPHSYCLPEQKKIGKRSKTFEEREKKILKKRFLKFEGKPKKLTKLKLKISKI
jgi:hypothetical protein